MHLEENGERKKVNDQTATHEAAPSRKEENKIKISSNRKYVLKESVIEKAEKKQFCPNSGSCPKKKKHLSWNKFVME